MKAGRKKGTWENYTKRKTERKEGRKTRNTKKGSEESKARKQRKRIQQPQDSLNGLTLTVRVFVSVF